MQDDYDDVWLNAFYKMSNFDGSGSLEFCLLCLADLSGTLCGDLWDNDLFELWRVQLVLMDCRSTSLLLEDVGYVHGNDAMRTFCEIGSWMALCYLTIWLRQHNAKCANGHICSVLTTVYGRLKCGRSKMIEGHVEIFPCLQVFRLRLRYMLVWCLEVKMFKRGACGCNVKC